MASRLLSLVVFAGCGRLSFDAAMPDGARPIDAYECANPIGHDEDGDTIDDACDVCPQLVDDQLDSDGDGVGDACDVATTQQQRTFFDPFTQMRPEWTYHSSVTFEGDSIMLPGNDTSIGIRLAGVPGRAVLETGGRVIGGGATGRRQIAIHVGDAAGVANYYCELYDGTGELLLNLTYTYDEVEYFTIDSTPIGGLLTPAEYRLAFVHAPPDLTCIAYWEGARYQASGVDPGGVVPEAMHVAVNNVTTELDYFDRLTTP